MNVWGKVFAVLVVLAAIANTFLTAKLIQVRNSYAAKAKGFETKYDTARAKLQEVRRQAEQLRNEWEATERDWGLRWVVNTQVTNAATGQLAVDLGTNHRLKDQQLLHGFEVLGEGQTVYRGAFVVTTAQADRSALQATWRVRPEDAQTWQSTRWRWRTMIPSGYSKRFDEQAMAFSLLDETLADRRATLQIQEQLIRNAQQQRKRRIAELLGGEELSTEESLPPEYTQGLAATLATTEEERNKVIVEIDDLRRRVRQARDAVRRLQQQNEQLVLKLPQPVSAVSRRD
uniref:Uncharacterized protein n=1 Tax=Schlesneria paludicola TaxID=360056 RepID=A0A7C4QPV0_9PLAN